MRGSLLIVSVSSIMAFAVSGQCCPFLGLTTTASRGSACTAEPGTPGTAQVDYLYLSIFANWSQNVDFFTPANFSVPAQSLIEVTVADYDQSPSNVSEEYTHVCGTVNGTMQVNGQSVSSVSANDVSHTFTITNGSNAGLNVPMPCASAKSPTIIKFSMYFSKPGVYHWQCETKCGDHPMNEDGRLSGLITVR